MPNQSRIYEIRSEGNKPISRDAYSLAMINMYNEMLEVSIRGLAEEGNSSFIFAYEGTITILDGEDITNTLVELSSYESEAELSELIQTAAINNQFVLDKVK